MLVLFFNESPPWLAAKDLKTKRKEEKKAQQIEINEHSKRTSEVESVLLEMEDVQDSPTAITERTTDVFVPSEIEQNGGSDEVARAIMHESREMIDVKPEQMTELEPVEDANESTFLSLIKIPKFSLAENLNPLVVALQLIFLANYSGMST